MTHARNLFRWIAAAMLGAALLLPASLHAQAPTTAPSQQPPQAQMLENLRKAIDELNLTDDQRTQLQGIWDEARQQLQALRQDVEQGNLSQQDRRQRFTQIMSDLRTKAGAVLDEQQKAQLREKWQQAMRARGEGPATRPTTQPRAGMIAERLKEALAKLDLSPEQKTQVDAVLASAQEKARELMAQAQGDRQAIAQQMRQLMQDTRQQLQQILTPEQQEKLREQMPERGPRQGPATNRSGQQHRGPRNPRNPRDPRDPGQGN